MVPLTLPSHVSMLTSTYPFVNGVEDNGERLAPGAVTLAGDASLPWLSDSRISGQFRAGPALWIGPGIRHL